jgi:hypothetical protein
MNPFDALLAQIEATATFLEGHADILDRWADESKSGGWSTHQVKANREGANDCRRQAARLRAAWRALP